MKYKFQMKYKHDCMEIDPRAFAEIILVNPSIKIYREEAGEMMDGRNYSVFRIYSQPDTEEEDDATE